MAVYRFFSTEGDKMLKLETDKATLLMSTRWVAGRDQGRWEELYKTPRGRFVRVERTLWQGELDSVYEVDEDEVLRELALAEDNQCTPEGEALLVAKDPSEDA